MPKTTSKNAPSRERIIDFLSSRGGELRSESGRGITAEIAKRAGYDNLSALNAMLTRLESEGAITREVRGRRTFAIRLAGGGRAGGRGSGGRRATSARRGTTTRRTAATRTATTTRRPAARRGRASAPKAHDLGTLLAALGEELVAMRAKNEELEQRLNALESLRSGARRRRAA